MRMVFIALVLAVIGLSACGLYFEESQQHNQQLPDASNNSVPDASIDVDGGTGCGSDGGYYPPDGWSPPDAGGDGGTWYPDAAFIPDAP